MRNHRVVLLVLGIVGGPLLIQAADWPQWNGPTSNGMSPEKGLLKKWPEKGPELVWTFDNAGTGYSAPVVVKGNVYLSGARKGDEFLFGLDAKGKEPWATKIGKLYDFEGNSWSGGPNASPAIQGNYLVALGSQGDLLCVDPASGKEHWRKSLPVTLSAEVDPVGGDEDSKLAWGFSAAPLIDGDQVIVTPGGPRGLVAGLDLKTGEVRWQSKDAKNKTTYASPIVAEIGGVKMVIAMTQDGAVGVSAKDGTLLWTQKRDTPYPDVVCTSPLVHGNQVLLTVGNAGGADLLELTPMGGKFAVKVVWSEKQIANRQQGVVLVDKHVYGYQELREWVCQEWATGAIAWNARVGPRVLGPSSLIYADGNLICLGEEKGEVALIEASPEKYKEISRFTLPQQSKLRKPRGRIWTHPVLSDGLLYLRDQDLVFCYKVK